MGRTWRTAVVVVVAITASSVGIAGAQAPATTVSVAPATDLVDGQVVQVHGEGVPVDTPLAIVQCRTSATAAAGCLVRSFNAETDEDGRVDVPFTIRGVLPLYDGDVDCRLPDACVVAILGFDRDGEELVELARAPVHLDPDAPLAPPPAVTAAPTDNLVDGQAVRVDGTGFVHARQVNVMQCAAGATDWDDCDWSTLDYATPTAGVIGLDQRVYARITTDSTGTIDCRIPGSCALLAFDDDASAGQAPPSIPLHFDPNGPLLPPPSVTVTPAAGLVDGQLIQVHGTGFIRDNSVRIFQCAPAAPSPDSCRMDDEWDYTEVDDDGSFSVERRLVARVATPDGLVDCRTSAQPCVVMATAAFSQPERTGSAELGFDPDGPLLPDPTITATPTGDLGDFTSVTVQGTRFTPDEPVPVQVCTVATPRRCDRVNGERPSADAAGRIATEFAVFASFDVTDDETGETEIVDCRTAGCAIEALDPERGISATAPLQFGPPDGPLGRYRDPVFSDVEVIHDVVYRQTTDYRGNPVELALDIYRPAGDAATVRPAVIWLYGGWFKFGDKSDYYIVDYATETARRGYVAVALNYRVRPDLDPGDLDELWAAGLDAYDDAVAGAQWLQEHGAEYGIDPAAIMATGISAGGATALSMAYGPEGRGPETSPLAAALPIVGVLATDIDPGDPPSIVFRGTADTILGPLNNTDTVCPKAAAVGVACEYVQYDGGGHIDSPGRWQDILRRGTDFVSEQVLGPSGYFDIAADAGGPYTVDEGGTVGLDGSASSGAGRTYAWTPAERVDDAGSATPRWTGLDDGVETATLAVTNHHGIAAGDSADVTTRNVAPTLDPVSVQAAPASRTLVLDGQLTDPGTADTHTAAVDWGDGVVSPATVAQSPGSAGLSASHDYAVGGRYTVTVTAGDDDGGTDTWTTTVVVGCTISGTARSEVLVGTSDDDVICGFGGRDVILGLDGNDTILGGDGPDLLLGGRGDDSLDGQAGWDFVIGGPGTNSCVAEVRLSCSPRRGG